MALSSAASDALADWLTSASRLDCKNPDNLARFHRFAQALAYDGVWSIDLDIVETAAEELRCMPAVDQRPAFDAYMVRLQHVLDYLGPRPKLPDDD